MLVGNFDKAILKSVGWGIILLICYYIWEMLLQELAFSKGNVQLFLGAYFVLSLAYWLLFGLPLHLILCKYAKTDYINYMLVPIVFCIYLIFYQLEAIALGFYAVFQMLAFRFYVFKT